MKSSLTIDTLKATAGIGIEYVWQYLLLLLFGGLLVSLFTAWAALALFGIPFFDTLAVVALLASVVILYFIFSSAHSVADWLGKEIDEAVEWSKFERFKLVSLATPKDAMYPSPKSTPLITQGVADPELVGGFDLKDLETLCRSFAAGMRWSETAMIGFELPHTHEVLTKERYYALIDVFVGKDIIGERGGPGNKTGTLTTKDSAEMIRRIRNQSPTLSNKTGNGEAQ